MSDELHEDTPLPGLAEPETPTSRLEAEARRSIRALDEAGLLSEEHAMTCQLVLELAAAVAAGTRSRKAAAAAMAAAQLREAWDSLPKPAEGGGDEDDPWTKLANDLRRAATARDTPDPQPAE